MSPASGTAAIGRPMQEATMAKKQEAAPTRNYPSHGVFVVEGDGDRAFRTRIGANHQAEPFMVM